MSKWNKLLNKIKTMNQNVRFDELKEILESYGYTMHSPGSGSSHFTFRKNGSFPITIPKNEPIKKVYVEMVRHIIEENENEKH